MNDIWMDRKAIVYGLADYLTKNTGKNINVKESITNKYRVAKIDDVWCYDTYVTYDILDGDEKIVSLKDMNNTVRGLDEFADFKAYDLDKYMSCSAAKMLFLGMSIKYDIDTMSIFDNILECDIDRNKYINSQNIDKVFENYSNNKKLVK